MAAWIVATALAAGAQGDAPVVVEDVPGGTTIAADAPADQDARDSRLDALEQKVQQLQAQLDGAQTETKAADERAARAEQATDAQKAAAADADESRLRRIDRLGDVRAVLTSVAQVLEAGSYEVAGSLDDADAALAETAEAAQSKGALAETRELVQARQSIAGIREALGREDFQAAKTALAWAMARTDRARELAEQLASRK